RRIAKSLSDGIFFEDTNIEPEQEGLLDLGAHTIGLATPFDHIKAPITALLGGYDGESFTTILFKRSPNSLSMIIDFLYCFALIKRNVLLIRQYNAFTVRENNKLLFGNLDMEGIEVDDFNNEEQGDEEQDIEEAGDPTENDENLEDVIRIRDINGFRHSLSACTLYQLSSKFKKEVPFNEDEMTGIFNSILAIDSDNQPADEKQCEGESNGLTPEFGPEEQVGVRDIADCVFWCPNIKDSAIAQEFVLVMFRDVTSLKMKNDDFQQFTTNAVAPFHGWIRSLKEYMVSLVSQLSMMQLCALQRLSDENVNYHEQYCKHGNVLISLNNGLALSLKVETIGDTITVRYDPDTNCDLTLMFNAYMKILNRRELFVLSDWHILIL
ncbi:hypothetical protein C6P45_004405, partial [Maudiozyma exigua]